MKILPILVLVACACAQAQDEEARPAARGLLKRGQPLRGKPTTTTTTPAPQDDAEYDDEAEYPVDGESQEPSTEAPPSSTEGKKLVGSGVRPFRSNTDLLEALKKKRQQALEAKHKGHSAPEATQAPEAPLEPAKSSYSKKRFNNAPAKDSSGEEQPAPKPTRGRFGRPATRSVQPDEEPAEAAPPARNTRTFARRGN